MKKYLWQLRVLAVGLAISSLGSWVFAASENWRFTQLPGENLIPLDQISPRQIVGETEINGHKISLGIQADHKSIDITPRSKVRLTVRLLEDGQPVKPSQIEDPSRRATGLTNFQKNPQLSINLTKLDGHIGLPPPNLTITQPGLLEKTNLKYGTYCPSGAQPYWAPLYVGTAPTGEIRNQLVGEDYLNKRGAYDEISTITSSYAVFDFADGDIEFEYIYGGVRTMPFVEFAVGITGFEGRLQSQLSLPFSDQVGKRAVPQVNEQGDGTIAYDVDFSKSALTPNQEDKITLAIQATNKGRAYTSPYQRVRITALPISKEARVERLSSKQNQASDEQYSPLLPDDDFRQVNVDVQMPGEFVIDDKINYELAGLLYTGPYTTKDECRTPATVEIDLINGKANVDYLFKGETGTNRQISFLVQPVNYFVPYPEWPLGAQINLDDAFRNERYDWIEKRRTTPTYREEQDLRYPLDKLPFEIEGSRPECVGGAGIKGGGCALPTIALYGDTWMPEGNIDFKTELDSRLWGENVITIGEFAQTNYTIASLPIGAQGGFNFWLWVLIAHILKTVILSIRLIMLKRKDAQPHT